MPVSPRRIEVNPMLWHEKNSPPIGETSFRDHRGELRRVGRVFWSRKSDSRNGYTWELAATA